MLLLFSSMGSPQFEISLQFNSTEQISCVNYHTADSLQHQEINSCHQTNLSRSNQNISST